MTTLFRGGEDIDFAAVGGSYGLTNAANIWVNATGGGAAFREGYARCALSPAGTLSGTSITSLIKLRSRQFSATDFWMTARIRINASTLNEGIFSMASGGFFLRFLDAGLVPRLRVRPGTFAALELPSVLQKLNAAATATTLAATTSGFSLVPSSPDKLDIHVNYAVAGSCEIYINNVLVLAFTGDMTTDGMTSLAYLELSSCGPNANTLNQANWSEVIVSTLDTRNQSLVTRAPVAAGNTDSWTGTAGDVNDLIANDAAPNTSAVAAQVQEYTVGTLPAGSFAILDVTQVVRATLGATGPQHLQLGNRLASDHFSTDLAPTIAWDTYSYTTTTNPETAVGYTTAELNAVGYNVAMKSTA